MRIFVPSSFRFVRSSPRLGEPRTSVSPAVVIGSSQREKHHGRLSLQIETELDTCDPDIVLRILSMSSARLNVLAHNIVLQQVRSRRKRLVFNPIRNHHGFVRVRRYGGDSAVREPGEQESLLGQSDLLQWAHDRLGVLPDHELSVPHR